jgi:hypothetical protein
MPSRLMYSVPTPPALKTSPFPFPKMQSRLTLKANGMPLTVGTVKQSCGDGRNPAGRVKIRWLVGALTVPWR